ncbi:MAG: adenylate/guanylate cyclase domain-containing protein [Opitutus sp.]
MIRRIQSFGTKLLVLFVLVVAAAQFVTWFIVSRANHAQARAQIERDLQGAATAFARVVEDRNALLAAGAATVARDPVFIQLIAGEQDGATIASMLQSFRLRMAADIAIAVSLDGKLLAGTHAVEPADDIIQRLVGRADNDPAPNPTARGYGYIDDELYSLVVAPARGPDILAWLVIGFVIDSPFARRLKEQTSGIDLTFVDDQRRVLATTLGESAARLVAAASPSMRGATARPIELPVGGETALVLTRPLPGGVTRHAMLALQYSLDEKLRPARATERTLLVVASASLLAAIFLSRGFARRLSRPIEQLAAHTRVIAAGDYRTPLLLHRSDELGRLADAFRTMTAGLEERDRVRDLLDKNVSPEVAAQLMRDGAALGGEEREVTILFADLRGFTTLSEKLIPHDLLTLLNRYLDRMSSEIERHGGIIDKFIGDAIMALFGAPLAQPDSANRAIAASLAMQDALAGLNRELAGEGRPELGIGIGINTARVVAGNIGSHRRLNYSVIGDGVNVAARLQSLTRTAEYRATIITSAATVSAATGPGAFRTRPLGIVSVKGRAEPVEIFAVEPTTGKSGG